MERTAAPSHAFGVLVNPTNPNAQANTAEGSAARRRWEPTKFEFVINLQTAKTNGRTVLLTLLANADVGIAVCCDCSQPLMALSYHSRSDAMSAAGES